jgi:hypothetical protein
MQALREADTPGPHARHDVVGLQVRQLSDHAVEEFLRFRNATVNLK